jgi:hypothetical protein
LADRLLDVRKEVINSLLILLEGEQQGNTEKKHKTESKKNSFHDPKYSIILIKIILYQKLVE